MMKKLVSVLIIAIMICSLFAACSDKKADSQAESSRVITVNGKIISNKVYDFYYNTQKEDNPLLSKDEMDKAAIKQSARRVFVDEMCRENNITIDDAGRATIDAQIASMIEQYGSEEDLINHLSQLGVDYDTYYSLMENSYLEYILRTEIIKTYTDEQREKFYNDNMVNVQHILITTVDENQMPLDEAVAQDKKALAEEVLEKIENGADFKEMVDTYNEDADLNADGYMLCQYSSFAQPFLDAALKLKVNEVSGLVETPYGYHIIKRYEHKGNQRLYENSVYAINDALFEQQFDQWYQEADIVVN